MASLKCHKITVAVETTNFLYTRSWHDTCNIYW